MENDRELLEYAAKTVGIDGVYYDKYGIITACYGGNDVEKWNPLTDDGDALRLAVKLGIKVTPYPIFGHEKHSVLASRRWLADAEDDDNTYVGPEVIEIYGQDHYAATRRAIVRAAAEIGKQMNGT